MIGILKLNEKILSRLICPVCRSPICFEEQILKCGKGHTFPCIDGVPVLRTNISQDSVTPKGGHELGTAEEILSSKSWKNFILRIIGTNYVPYPVLPGDFIKPDYQVLNLGSGMKERLSGNTTNLDYYLFPVVDIVADAHRIPFTDETFDMVVSEYMLEHVPDPARVCLEMLRVLKAGGILYISYPFIHSYHSFPKDHFRFTYTGIQEMLPGTELVRRGPLTGPACRWISATADLVSCLLGMGPKSKAFLRLVTLCLLFPLKFIDIYLNRRADAVNHSITLYGIFRRTSVVPARNRND